MTVGNINCLSRACALHKQVTELSDAGIDATEAEPGTGRTALHKAAFWGHVHLLPILVDKVGYALR